MAQAVLHQVAGAPLALLDQSLGDDAELLAVDQGLSVGIRRGGHEQGVDLESGQCQWFILVATNSFAALQRECK